MSDPAGFGRRAAVLFLCAVAGRLHAQGWQDPSLRLVPIVLSSSGLNGAFYTSELTLTNRGTTNSTLTFTYTAAFGGGSGSGTYFLPAGRQEVDPDAIAFLQGIGVPIPATGNRGGTLLVRFDGLSSPDAGGVTVRTLSPVPEGRAGLAYPGFAPATAYQGTVWVGGLRQNAADRSNLALVNAGTAGDGDVTLRITLYDGDGSANVTLPDVTLSPGGFSQLTQVLTGPGYPQGFASVARVNGTAPFFAYGVVNDQANADGSFVPPVADAAFSVASSMTLPAVVEAGPYTTEVVLANWSGFPKSVALLYASDALTSGGKTATLTVALPARQQLVIPSFVQYLRDRHVAGVPAPGATFAGPLGISVAQGDLRGIFAGARTSAPGSAGRYGVFYTANVDGRTETRDVWIHGLQQTAIDRSNLALVNTGDTDGNPDLFSIDLYDGATGAKVTTVSGVAVAAHRFFQIGSILTTYAPGVPSAYAHVRQTGGVNSFIAYGVVNDGAQPNQRSGDGAFLASSSVGGRILANVQMSPLRPDTITYLQANAADAASKGITLTGSSAQFPTSAGGFEIYAGDRQQPVNRSGFFSFGSFPSSTTTAEARGGGEEQAFRLSFPAAAMLVADGQPPEPLGVAVTLPDADRSAMNPPGSVVGGIHPLVDTPLPCPRPDTNGVLCPTNGCPPCYDKPVANPDMVCLDYNGLCSDGHHYAGADCSLASVNFFGSVCYYWSVDFPCCLNEGAYINGGPSCFDNHKGRNCQALESEAFAFQMTTGSLATTEIPMETIENVTVQCGQSVSIALHNTTCQNASDVSFNGASLIGDDYCTAGGILTGPGGALIGRQPTPVLHYTGSPGKYVHQSDLTMTYTAPSAVPCGTAKDIIAGFAGGNRRYIVVTVPPCSPPPTPPPQFVYVLEDFDSAASTTNYRVNVTTSDGSNPTFEWKLIYPPTGTPCGSLVDPNATGATNGFHHPGCPESFEQTVKIQVFAADAHGHISSCTFCARKWEGMGPIPAVQSCTTGSCP